MEDKKKIENRQKLELDGMAHFLDNIILLSLDMKVGIKYKNFLVCMEEHDNSVFHVMVERLGK